ncbi:MAG: hypothetical protein HQ575_00850 [Candidatus Omnitrophica bacterium]|nr:hypothetical protein [Candidatus Omnitrophota bacterium]
MKITKFLITLISITILTFMHTHQRIEAIKLSYSINEREAALHKLLDRRRELEYNVAKLKTPTHLEFKLAKEDIKLVLPERWQVFEAAGLREEGARKTRPLLLTAIMGLFSLESEARATPSIE